MLLRMARPRLGRAPSLPICVKVGTFAPARTPDELDDFPLPGAGALGGRSGSRPAAGAAPPSGGSRWERPRTGRKHRLGIRPERARNRGKVSPTVGIRRILTPTFGISDGPDTAREVVTVGVTGQVNSTASRGAALGPAWAQVGPLVGRREAIATARALLAATRLLTIVGPSGVGKSALARHAAQAVPEVAWADLSGVTERGALGHIARAMGVSQPASEPALSERLAGWSGLLVLDGCEQSLELCARLAGDVIGSSSNARLLATSQRSLGLYGEVRWALPPLTVPTPGATSLAELRASGAGELLLDRMLQRQPDFRLDHASARALAEICRRLQGFPLAVELVAARLAEAGVESVARALRDPVGGPAHDFPTPLPMPLGRVLALVTARLARSEKEVLSCLLELPAGVDVGDLHRLLHDDGQVDPDETRALVTGLVDRSLVSVVPSPSGARYRLSPTVVRYWRERPVPSYRKTALARRRVSWCMELVRGAESSLLTGSSQRQWLERLEAEEENLRAVLDSALADADPTTAGMLAAELWRFWELRGRLAEGRAWLERILASPGPGPSLRRRLLDGQAMLAWRQGDHRAAQASIAEALAQDPPPPLAEESRLQHHLGLVAAFANQSEEALALLTQAEAGHRRCGEHGQAALARASIALVLGGSGQTAAARSILEAALGTDVVTGDVHASAIALLHLGIVSTLEGRATEARSQFIRAGQDFLELGDDRSAAFALLGLAASLGASAPGLVLTLAAAATTAVERLGTPVPEPWASQAAAALTPAWRAAGARGGELFAAGKRLSLSEALRLATELGEDIRTAPARARMDILGRFAISRGEQALPLVGQPALLVKLLAASEDAMAVDAVIEAMWPEVDPPTGRWRLRNVLSRLRREAGPLVVRRDERLALAEGVQVDARRFARDARVALGRLAEGDPMGLIVGRAALADYGGDLLPADLYEEWSVRPRERLRSLRLRLLDQLAARAREVGELDSAEQWLREAVESDPWDERRHLELARSLHASGSPVAALEVIQRVREMNESYGVAVSGRLLELERSIRPD